MGVYCSVCGDGGGGGGVFIANRGLACLGCFNLWTRFGLLEAHASLQLYYVI
jgi:hypothetical protein